MLNIVLALLFVFNNNRQRTDHDDEQMQISYVDSSTYHIHKVCFEKKGNVITLI